MEKEKSNPYTFFILRYRLVNLQGDIFAFEKEKNKIWHTKEQKKNRKTKSLQFTNNVTNVTKIKLINH